MDPYEDIEDPQSNQRRLARISESINRALLYDTTGVEPSLKNSNNNCMIYIIGSALIITIVIIVILVVKIIT